MLPLLFLTWLSILPLSAGIINCRIACRHCRQKLEHPDMLEVYCAMCDECKERRREWLEGAPSLLRLDNNEEYLTNHGEQDLQDDCITTPADECEEPQRLTHTFPTTTTTTTTSTTTTTTHRPCPPRPCIKPTTPPCYGIACPIPMCQMCPMPMGSFYTLTPSSVTAQPVTEPTEMKLSGMAPSTSELYIYLGVPKKLLKQLNLSNLRNE